MARATSPEVRPVARIVGAIALILVPPLLTLLSLVAGLFGPLVFVYLSILLGIATVLCWIAAVFLIVRTRQSLPR